MIKLTFNQSEEEIEELEDQMRRAVEVLKLDQGDALYELHQYYLNVINDMYFPWSIYKGEP